MNLVALRHRLFATLSVAEEAGDGGMIAKLASQLHHNLETTARLLGDIGVGSVTINDVLLVPAYLTMRTELVRALQPYPDARAAVAAVLSQLEERCGQGYKEHEDRTASAWGGFAMDPGPRLGARFGSCATGARCLDRV